MRVYGESEHQIDDKGRINVPKRFQNLFEGGAFLTRGFDGLSLVVYGREAWDAMQRLLDSIPFTEDALDAVERCLGCGSEVAIDAQGRLTIPPNLRRRAELTDEVTLIGRGNKMEIWNSATWRAYDAETLTKDTVKQALNDISQRLPDRI